MEHKRTKPGSFECMCGSRIDVDEKYDAYYCIDSKEWVEKNCADEKCYFCTKRPKKHRE